MNQSATELWKLHFDSWPQALVEKFSKEIEIELNLFDSQIGLEARNFFESSITPSLRNWSIDVTGGFQRCDKTILYPTNPKYITSASVDLGWTWFMPGYYLPDSPLYPGFSIENFIYSALVNFTGNITWDTRIFSTPISLSYALGHNLLSGQFMVIDNSSARNYWRAYYAQPRMDFSFSNSLQPYRGVYSLIALHENGIDFPNTDFGMLYDFQTYLDAYNSYLAEIKSNALISKKTAEADLQNYKSDLDSKLISQKNDLQNLTLQLTSQTQGQADSAKRDVQQLQMQFSAMKLQILGLIK